MNNKLRGVLLLLVGFGLIVIGLVAVYFLTRQSGGVSFGAPAATPTPIPVAKNEVVVLSHDMKLGELLEESDLSLIQVPAEYLPRNAVTDIALAAGRFLKTDMVQGEMLLSHNLADPTNVNRDLAYILDKDHVLMAVSVSDVMTRESLVKRGDIVDVFVSISETVPQNEEEDETAATTTEEDEMVTSMFTFDAFQKMDITAMVMDVITEENQESVLESGQVAPTPNPNQEYIIRAYLLALNPQDALVMKHLKDNGAIFDLVIRNPNSVDQFDLIPVTKEYIVELYGLEILK